MCTFELIKTITAHMCAYVQMNTKVGVAIVHLTYWNNHNALGSSLMLFTKSVSLIHCNLLCPYSAGT